MIGEGLIEHAKKKDKDENNYFHEIIAKDFKDYLKKTREDELHIKLWEIYTAESFVYKDLNRFLRSKNTEDHLNLINMLIFFAFL